MTHAPSSVNIVTIFRTTLQSLRRLELSNQAVHSMQAYSNKWTKISKITETYLKTSNLPEQLMQKQFNGYFYACMKLSSGLKLIYQETSDLLCFQIVFVVPWEIARICCVFRSSKQNPPSWDELSPFFAMQSFLFLHFGLGVFLWSDVHLFPVWKAEFNSKFTRFIPVANCCAMLWPSQFFFDCQLRNACFIWWEW